MKLYCAERAYKGTDEVIAGFAEARSIRASNIFKRFCLLFRANGLVFGEALVCRNLKRLTICPKSGVWRQGKHSCRQKQKKLDNVVEMIILL